MAVCHQCRAKLSANVNYWQQAVTPNDNQNSREDISKFPISWSSEMLAFCSSACMAKFIAKSKLDEFSRKECEKNSLNHFSDEQSKEITAKLDGTPSDTSIVNILREPYKYTNITKQELDRRGFNALQNKKVVNDITEDKKIVDKTYDPKIVESTKIKPISDDNVKDDGRSQHGLSTPYENDSQKPVFKKLKELKNKQNNMETNAKKIIQCDECKKPITKEDTDAVKATLADIYNPEKTKPLDLCSEQCLLAHLQRRSKKRKSKASWEFEIIP